MSSEGEMGRRGKRRRRRKFPLCVSAQVIVIIVVIVVLAIVVVGLNRGHATQYLATLVGPSVCHFGINIFAPGISFT